MSDSLEPTGKIPPQPWMTRPETRAVIAALTKGGRRVRFVGGCVRDVLAGRPVKDVDIATPDTPERVMDLLQEAGIKAVPTGLKHGTVTAVADGVPFEITTLRIDVETDGRRAKVAFTDDWIADARRRDLTINTLSSTPEGDVFDPFGGMDDLAHGRVRFVGVARQRIEEDLLRILRFFRFYGIFGRPPLNEEALAACRGMASRLTELSAERIRSELFAILLTGDPAEVLGLMRGARVLEAILPEARNLGRLRTMGWLDSRAIKVESVVPDAVRRLAAVLEVDREGALAVAGRLKLSNRDRTRLAFMASEETAGVSAGMGDGAVKRALRRDGADGFLDRVLLAWAGERAVGLRRPAGRTETWMRLIDAAQTWEPVEFPLKGRDVIALGVPPGEEVGTLLAAVEAWWEQGDCQAGRETCLEKLENLRSWGGY